MLLEVPLLKLLMIVCPFSPFLEASVSGSLPGLLIFRVSVGLLKEGFRSSPTAHSFSTVPTQRKAAGVHHKKNTVWLPSAVLWGEKDAFHKLR